MNKNTHFLSSLFVAIGLVSSSLYAVEGDKKVLQAAEKKPVVSESSFSGWKKFHSVVGGCSMVFPEAPEHVTQKMALEEDNSSMQYDVYVSTEKDKQAVYMVLIAQYPSYVNESYADLSLESFLNGILSQHPQNQLVFADMIEVSGHKGMDFFIKTQSIYFKGRTIMSGSNIYLIAMECEGHNYQENKFNYFINSFQFTSK